MITFEKAQLIESYFKQKSQKHYFINVMNNHKLPPIIKSDGTVIHDFENTYIRKEHNFAHIAVMYYIKKSDKFNEYDERTYYYITSFQDGILQLRKELVDHWGHNDVSDMHVLVIDEKNCRVADFPVKILISKKPIIGRAQNLDFLYQYVISDNDLIWTNITNFVPKEWTGSLMTHWQYMGNVKYTKYKAGCEIKVIFYKDNKKEKSVNFKSPKQAYDVIKGDLDISFRTFQRRCLAEKPSLIKTDKMSFYVTNKIDFEGPERI